MKAKRISRALATAMCVAAAVLWVTAYSATSNILIQGTIPDSKLFDGPATVTVRELTIKPGEALPMHYHPGHTLIVVKSGTLTVEDGCGEQKKLGAGEGLEEMNGRIHRGKNIDATDVVVYDIFITSPGKPLTSEVPTNEPRCGPPAEVKECQNRGWRQFNHPRSFSNQGQCIEFVRHMSRALSH